ncbi:hypothetical protein RFI_33297, partial [Reticulomyxa filosa]
GGKKKKKKKKKKKGVDPSDPNRSMSQPPEQTGASSDGEQRVVGTGDLSSEDDEDSAGNEVIPISGPAKLKRRRSQENGKSIDGDNIADDAISSLNDTDKDKTTSKGRRPRRSDKKTDNNPNGSGQQPSTNSPDGSRSSTPRGYF